tara:strand:+ start:97 stop:954 length:858 start_codon:yes stop_codon:yes gene_type:complete
MKTYFITRFNIIDYEFKGFKLTQNNSLESYKELFFKKERIEFKVSILLNVTLPSVVNQNDNDWMWHIYTSKYLPVKYLNNIKDVVKNHKQINLFEIEDFNEFYNNITIYPYEKNYATVRLDDDDAICDNYVRLLSNYKEENNKIISFPLGRKFEFVKGKIKVGEKCNNPNIALGLAKIDGVIYNCGDHSSMHNRYEIIYDNTPNVYLLCCSEHCDTKRKLIVKIPFLIKLKSIVNNQLRLNGLEFVRLESLYKIRKLEDVKLDSIYMLFLNIIAKCFGYIIIKSK